MFYSCWWDQSFWLAKTVLFYLKPLFLHMKTIISSKIRSHQPKWMILLKNTFPLDRKKLLLTGVSQGSQKKKTKQKTNKQTKHSGQKTLFPLGRKSVYFNRINNFFKNTFPRDGIAAFTLKNLWESPNNCFPLAGIWFILKNWFPSNFKNSFH